MNKNYVRFINFLIIKSCRLFCVNDLYNNLSKLKADENVVYHCFIFSIIMLEILTYGCKKGFFYEMFILILYCFVRVLTQFQMFYPQAVINYIIGYARCYTNTESKL